MNSLVTSDDRYDELTGVADPVTRVPTEDIFRGIRIRLSLDLIFPTRCSRTAQLMKTGTQHFERI